MHTIFLLLVTLPLSVFELLAHAQKVTWCSELDSATADCWNGAVRVFDEEFRRGKQQSCKVHRLPKTKASAFRTFVRQQAIVFLTAVDDWLEARVEAPVQKRRKSKLCAAGVFTFAYLDPAKANRRSVRGKG